MRRRPVSLEQDAHGDTAGRRSTVIAATVSSRCGSLTSRARSGRSVTPRCARARPSRASISTMATGEAAAAEVRAARRARAKAARSATTAADERQRSASGMRGRTRSGPSARRRSSGLQAEIAKQRQVERRAAQLAAPLESATVRVRVASATSHGAGQPASASWSCRLASFGNSSSTLPAAAEDRQPASRRRMIETASGRSAAAPSEECHRHGPLRWRRSSQMRGHVERGKRQRPGRALGASKPLTASFEIRRRGTRCCAQASRNAPEVERDLGQRRARDSPRSSRPRAPRSGR